MYDIQIKKATPSEWEAYKAIRLEALLEEPQAYRTTYAEAEKYTDEEWKKYTTTAIILIAYDGEKSIGMVGAYYDAEGVAVVIGVYLTKEYRGKGIGKKLMQSLEEAVKKEEKAKKMKLWVAVEQAAALELYKRVGFQIVGTESMSLGDGKNHDEYIMEKVLEYE